MLFSDPEPNASPPTGWQSESLPAAVGACRNDRLQVQAGLAVVLTRYRPREDLLQASERPGAAPALTVTVALDGDSGYRSRDGAALCFRGGHTTVSAAAATCGTRLFDGRRTVRQLRVSVAAPLLQRYCGEAAAAGWFGGASLRTLAFAPTSAAVALHAHALARLAEAGDGQLLAVHTHALALLAEQLRPLLPAPLGLAAGERARLEHARALMEQSLERPLRVAALAAAVGLSAARLRAGFEQLYGAPPARLLLDLRMQHARELLAQGCQAAVAGYRVGYAHPASFSAAFARHFGHPPRRGRRG